VADTSRPGPELGTRRLLLRRWQLDDREPFAALNADPAVMRYFRGALDRAASDAFVDRIEASFDELGYGLWAVQHLADGRFLGFTGLARQTFPAHFTPAVEIGWRFARSVWGHGYATEAGRAVLGFAFGTLGLDEVVSITARTNAPSRAVMDRLGMTYDPSDDFDYPLLPEGHPFRPSVLYRASAGCVHCQQLQQPAVGGETVHHSADVGPLVGGTAAAASERPVVHDALQPGGVHDVDVGRTPRA
jgi:RimJ/RimL family protein N-acetyltransferase